MYIHVIHLNILCVSMMCVHIMWYFVDVHGCAYCASTLYLHILSEYRICVHVMFVYRASSVHIRCWIYITHNTICIVHAYCANSMRARIVCIWCWMDLHGCAYSH